MRKPNNWVQTETEIAGAEDSLDEIWSAIKVDDLGEGDPRIRALDSIFKWLYANGGSVYASFFVQDRQSRRFGSAMRSRPLDELEFVKRFLGLGVVRGSVPWFISGHCRLGEACVRSVPWDQLARLLEVQIRRGGSSRHYEGSIERDARPIVRAACEALQGEAPTCTDILEVSGAWSCSLDEEGVNLMYLFIDRMKRHVRILACHEPLD